MHCRIFGLIKKHLLAFVAGMVFSILCFLGINIAIKPFSSSEYCGSQCHEMGTAYQSWELSEHGSNKYGFRVECADCHLPPKDKFFRHTTMKAYYGAKDTYKHYFGDEYDGQEIRKKVIANFTNEPCLNCHDNLLARPSSPAAGIAHQGLLNQNKDVELKCIQCHENLHERKKKIFVPD